MPFSMVGQNAAPPQRPPIGGERLRDFKKKAKGGFKGRQSPRASAMMARIKRPLTTNGTGY